MKKMDHNHFICHLNYKIPQFGVKCYNKLTINCD